MKKSTLIQCVVVLLAIVAVTVLVFYTPGCASNAPHSLTQLEQMDEAQYEDWRTNTVRPWSENAGTMLIVSELATQDQVSQFTADLRIATAGAETLTANVLVDVAKKLGWKDRKTVLIVVMAGQAILDARGGLHLIGPRTKDVLMTIAAGIDAGALVATQGPLQPR